MSNTSLSRHGYWGEALRLKQIAHPFGERPGSEWGDFRMLVFSAATGRVYRRIRPLKLLRSLDQL